MGRCSTCERPADDHHPACPVGWSKARSRILIENRGNQAAVIELKLIAALGERLLATLASPQLTDAWCNHINPVTKEASNAVEGRSERA